MNKPSRGLIWLAFPIVMVTVPPSSLHGQTEAIRFTSVTGGFRDGLQRVIGWEFTTGSRPLLVNQLGVFDFNEDGLQSAHDVAIYDFQSRTALVTATVPSGTAATLSGLFRSVVVNPTILRANRGYIIAASWPGTDEFVWSPTSDPSGDIVDFSVDAALTLGITNTGMPASARFECCADATLRFPTQRIGDVFPGNPRIVFVGPTFQFRPVTAPEATIRVSEVEICWLSDSNLTYKVQFRSELTTNAWQDLAGPLQGGGTNSCVRDSVPLGQPQRFYRVIDLP